MNNFEKIKAMSLDEMAVYLSAFAMNMIEVVVTKKRAREKDIIAFARAQKQWLEQEEK